MKSVDRVLIFQKNIFIQKFLDPIRGKLVQIETEGSKKFFTIEIGRQLSRIFQKKYFHTEISRSLGCYPGKVSTNETEEPKKAFHY